MTSAHPHIRTSAQYQEGYRLIARILRYPGPEQTTAVALVAEAGFSGGEASLLGEFFARIGEMEHTALEELYVATFDVNAACCLDVGYALFGEDYKRGVFMAEVKSLHARHGVDCGRELPDFLPNVLELLVRLPYAEAAELNRLAVTPAVERMIASFRSDCPDVMMSGSLDVRTPGHQDIKTSRHQDNPYVLPLKALRGILARDYGIFAEGGSSHV